MANKLSDSIICYEQSYRRDYSKTFPLENYYLEDEIYQSDDEDDLQTVEEMIETSDTLDSLLDMKKITQRAVNQLKDDTRLFYFVSVRWKRIWH